MNGKTGFIVPNGDQLALKQSIQAILDNKEKAKEMGRNGRQLVLERFSDTAMTTRILEMAQQQH